MLFLKLRGTLFCKCRRHFEYFSNCIHNQRLPGQLDNQRQLLVLCARSLFHQNAAPTASFTSSNSTSDNFRRRKWQNPTDSALHPRHLVLLPCRGWLQRTYSVSHQLKQKQDSPKTSGPGTDQPEAEHMPQNTEKDTDIASDAQDEPPKGLVARFKDAYKNYGKVLVGVHCVTSAVWFSTFYYAAYVGIDVVPLLNWVGLSERFISPFQSSAVGDLAVAYLLYKLATPARYTVTIVGTQYMVTYLRASGLMKPVPEGSRIRDFVKESRVQVREKYEDLKDEVREKGEEFKDKIEEKRDEFKDKIEEKRDEFKVKQSGTDNKQLKGSLKNRSQQ